MSFRTQILYSQPRWSARPLPSNTWKRFALTTGVGLAIATGTAATLGVVSVSANNAFSASSTADTTGTTSEAEKWKSKSTKVWITRADVAKKLGLPMPAIDAQLNEMSIETLGRERESARTTMFSAATIGLAFTGAALALFNPRTPHIRGELLTFRGPAIVTGTCAALSLLTIPLSLHPVYDRLDQQQRTMIEFPKYWNWKE